MSVLVFVVACTVAACTATGEPTPSPGPTLPEFYPPVLYPSSFDVTQGDMRYLAFTWDELDPAEASFCCIDPADDFMVVSSSIPSGSNELVMVAWIAPDAASTLTWGVQDPGGQALVQMQVAPRVNFVDLQPDTPVPVTINFNRDLYRPYRYTPPDDHTAFWTTVSVTGNRTHRPRIYLVDPAAPSILAGNGGGRSRALVLDTPELLGAGMLPDGDPRPLFFYTGDIFAGTPTDTHELTLREVDMSAPLSIDEGDEPNDIPANALSPGPLSVATAYQLDGNLNTVGSNWSESDSDLYRISVDLDADIFMRLQWPEDSTDVDLFVYAPGATPDPDSIDQVADLESLYELVMDYSITENPGEELSFAALAGQEYLVQIVGWSGLPTDYQLTAAVFER